MLETSKIRDRVLKYCEGTLGVDIGCKTDKIKPEATGIDKDYYEGVNFLLDASKNLPFEDGTFNWVYSSHALEDLENTKGALIEWLRIVKPRGHIILYLPHKDLYKGCNVDHKHEFVPEDITSILIDLNCEIIESYVDEGDNRYSFVVVGRKK